MIEVEQLREALASAKQIEAALTQRLREQDLVLGGLQAIMNADDPAALMTQSFGMLREAVDFDAALVLGADGGGFLCTDATNAEAIGRRWPDGGFFRRVADGRAAVVPANLRIPDWAAADYRPPPGAGLYAPLHGAEGEGLLILCSATHGRYSAKDLALATRFGLLVTQSIAARQRRVLADEARRAGFERRAAVEANEAKSRFLANMSHEIRTPLNGITTVAELMAATELSARQTEMVRLIRDSGSMLEGLLNDVLDFARIESGHLKIESRSFDLEKVLRSVFDLFGAKADEKGLRFAARIADAARGSYRGDDLRIRQVASNLLSNAVKFTPGGSVEVDVVAGDEDAGTRITITVRDTGIGFSEATAARLFSRFEQGEVAVTREYGGSGLGLAISRSLARLMGGDVVCASTPGEGATFAFSFIVRRTAPPAAVAPPKTTALRVLRILVAEDNAINQKIVAMVLEAIGAEVSFTENGREALDALSESSFDLVLMDLQMPVMDGLTAMRELRRAEHETGAARLPVIALSANAMTHHVAEALDAGADAHIAKPIAPGKLLATIATLCGGGASGKAIRGLPAASAA